MPPRLLLPSLLSGCLVVLGACSNTQGVTSMLSPYRIDVRQGNLVTQDMVAKLKPGMTKDQVRFVLGTPLVSDIFHADRWDYVYRLQPGKGEVQQRRLIIYFQDEKLARVGGDVVAATDAPAADPAAPTARVIDVPSESKKD